MLKRIFGGIVLWITASITNAQIQDNDFWIHNEGQSIIINGAKGAPLYISYIGAKLIQPLKVSIIPDNPKIKVIPSECVFTKTNDDCRLIAKLVSSKDKVYGIQSFTIEETLGKANKMGAEKSNEAVSFGVGVQLKDMPTPVFWNTKAPVSGKNGRVILVNSTPVSRTYKGFFSIGVSYNYKIESYDIEIPSGELCYFDSDSMNADEYPSDYKPDYFYYLSGNWLHQQDNSRIVKDVTDPSDPIFNGAYSTGNNNISTCSANDMRNCASNKWESWTVGLANTGADNLKGGLRAGQVVALGNNSWDSGDVIYYRGEWAKYGLELLLIQGTIDGKAFDANASLPSALSIRSASPCSNYIK